MHYEVRPLTILAILYLFTFLLIWQFVGYPLVMAFLAAHKPKHARCGGVNCIPFISIVVPTYNEESVIERKLINLLSLRWPRDKYEVIVVDSGSTGMTCEIVERFIRTAPTPSPIITLLRERERRGKASAINLGAAVAKGDIVLVTDADCTFNHDALSSIARHFDDPRIGGVGGRYVNLNVRTFTGRNESIYWDVESLMRKGEYLLDSACTFHGEINAWRKEIVRADPKMISEDLDMSTQIRRNGYRIGYEPAAVAYEPTPTNIKEQMMRRNRVAIGTIQCIFKHWNYLLVPRDLYTLFIFLSHKLLPMISPFLLGGILALYYIINDIGIIALHMVVTFFTVVVLSSALMAKRKSLINEPDVQSLLRPTSMGKLVVYLLINEGVILLAWINFLLRRYSVLWAKSESGRRWLNQQEDGSRAHTHIGY